MHKKLIIVGAGGHGKVVADIAIQTKEYQEIAFIDDNSNESECMGIEIIGKSVDVKEYVGKVDFIVAIGNAEIRKKVMCQLVEMGGTFATLIHPTAVIGSRVTIEEGTVVMAGAVLNPHSEIGKGCIVNTHATVDHDCKLGNYVHVAVGAHLCGNVKVGNYTWIGAGVTVRNNTTICENCIIGVGAAVVKNINEAGTYVGVPARRM